MLGAVLCLVGRHLPSFFTWEVLWAISPAIMSLAQSSIAQISKACFCTIVLAHGINLGIGEADNVARCQAMDDREAEAVEIHSDASNGKQRAYYAGIRRFRAF